MAREDNRTRLIRIEDGVIHLTPEHAVARRQTNLPPSLSFKTSKVIFWLVRLEDYQADGGHLTLRVMDYYPIDHQGFDAQVMRGTVQSLLFTDLEWKYLEPFLSSYRKSDLADLIIDSQEIIVPDFTPRVIPLRLKVYLKDIKFHLGYVSLYHQLEGLGREVEIRISNTHILPEYEYIKHFFSKQLRRKTVDIDGAVHLQGDQVVKVDASSPQIARINERMIETMKTAQVMVLKRQSLVKSIDKSLFTADQAFDATDAEDHGNVFKLRVEDIIKTLKESGVVRNRKQLEYLAGKKQSAQSKIFLTLQPLFGFLFLIKGESMYHFCWELLNSHATYLWSLPIDEWEVSEAYQMMESTIQEIRQHGRDRYKQSYAAGKSSSELIFHMIVHRYADSHLIDPFPLWRQKLEERLI